MDDSKLADNSKPSGPIRVGDYYIRVDRNLCIGAATCIAIAPKVFTLDNEAKAIIINSASQETFDTILDSAKGCPTSAIIITDLDGKNIYPK